MGSDSADISDNVNDVSQLRRKEVGRSDARDGDGIFIKCLAITGGGCVGQCGRLSQLWAQYVYTVSQKIPIFKFSVTLSYFNRFSKLLQYWKAYRICYETRSTLPTSP